MNYTRSVLSSPYPYSYYNVGKQTIIEWKMATEGNPVNKIFLQLLNTGGKNAQRFFSSLDQTEKFFLNNQFLSPNLFIFHMSRCGSSYAANYFASNSENRVFSEPNLLIQFIKNNWDQKLQDNLSLKSAIQLLGCGAMPEQKRLIIKLTSNYIRKFSEIHSLYPTVPKLFLYRDPKEVLISLLEGPPVYLPSREEGEKQVLLASIKHLELVFEIVLKNREHFHSFINYTNLKEGIKQIESQFSWNNNSRTRIDLLRLIENQNSKNIEIQFLPDNQEKQEKWAIICEKYKISIKKLETQYQKISETN